MASREMPEREDDAFFWRERAAQLEEALQSRIVIEQAKGILAERFGLGLEGSFGLIRHAARSNRMKIHVLARAVTTERETPKPIVRSLAAQAHVFVAVSREQRVADTEKLFKDLNLSIAELLDGKSGGFLCECGNPLCNETIDLDPEDLKMLHSRDGFYAIIVGHQIPDLETVVMENDRFAIVRNNGYAFD
ncbi:MAG: ANTAR domain-containing protein [Gaiellaceae bacterium]|jgi:hypothetical protein|nr:ANTAR domain-containing protein [Acidobacteriota bacterium]